MRARVHVLHEHLRPADVPGITEITPGVRSLQVQFDPGRAADGRGRSICSRGLDGELPAVGPSSSCPVAPSGCRCRGTTRPRTRRSSATCTASAPTRRGARGTSSSSGASTASTTSRQVHDIVFDAQYLVLGLGDVYLGAPVATPLDPRHRLVTTKYNPARTWTPENAVGIGGAYLCIYGMEGPGGYQFVGRTTQVWNHCHPRDARLVRAGNALAAALFRPDQLLPGQRGGTAGPARRHGRRARRRRHRRRRVLAGRLPATSSATNADGIAAFRAAAGRRVRRRAARRGTAPASSSGRADAIAWASPFTSMWHAASPTSDRHDASTKVRMAPTGENVPAHRGRAQVRRRPIDRVAVVRRALGGGAGGAVAVQQLDAVYFDTPDHDLAAHQITLRRRTGGTDAGWHLKLPAGPDARTEVRAPLGDDVPMPTSVPDELARRRAGDRAGPAAAPGRPDPHERAPSTCSTDMTAVRSPSSATTR